MFCDRSVATTSPAGPDGVGDHSGHQAAAAGSFDHALAGLDGGNFEQRPLGREQWSPPAVLVEVRSGIPAITLNADLQFRVHASPASRHDPVLTFCASLKARKGSAARARPTIAVTWSQGAALVSAIVNRVSSGAAVLPPITEHGAVVEVHLDIHVDRADSMPSRAAASLMPIATQPTSPARMEAGRRGAFRPRRRLGHVHR